MVRSTGNLLVQFSVVSFTIISLTAVVLALILSYKIRADALEALVYETVGNTKGHLLRAITAADMTAPMHGARYDWFNNFIQASVLSERTARVKIWAKDGTLIYSNDPTFIGQRFPIKENLQKALHGENAVSISVPKDPENAHDTHLGRLLEVYTPLIFPPATEPQGAFEIYQYYEPTAQRIRSTYYWLFGSIGVGFIVLYISLGAIVRGGWGTIKRQQASLAEVNVALHAARDELERRVKERTADLAEANNALRNEIAERIQVEAALQESKHNLHVLSSHLLTAQERERRRLSIELHDELGQSLTTLKMQIWATKRMLSGDQDSIDEMCDQTIQRVDDIIDNVRRLSGGLSPTILEDLGLTAALHWMLKEFCEYRQIDVVADLPNVDMLFSLDEQVLIYRIFQEALTNISKHAQATQATVSFVETDSDLIVNIIDNGQGLEAQQATWRKTTKPGLGLTAMHERAKMLGGHLEVCSQEGNGTSIVCRIPIRRCKDGAVSNRVGR